MSEIEDRLDRLESLVEQQQDRIENQQDTIERQRERIEDLQKQDADVDTQSEEHSDGSAVLNRRSALKAGGLLTLLGAGAGATAADPQGQVGTADDPIQSLYTDELYGNGGSVAVQDTLDLNGNNLTSTSVGTNVSVDVDSTVGGEEDFALEIEDASGNKPTVRWLRESTNDNALRVETESGVAIVTRLRLDDDGTLGVTGDITNNSAFTIETTSTGDLTLNAAGNVALDTTLDTNGSDLENNGTTIWDASNDQVPVSSLESGSLTVAGNTVSLGGSTSVGHSDLSGIGTDDHHTRPSAGDGLKENSSSFDVEPSDFAGNALEDDGSDNLAVSTGGVGTGELNTPFSELKSLFGSPVSAGADIDMSGFYLTDTSGDLGLEGSPDINLIDSSFNVNGNTIYDSAGFVTIDDYLTVKNFEKNSGTNLVVDSNGDISKESSSLRYKTDIEPLDWPTAPVLDLEPRSFEFEETGVSDFGLIAEEVEEILPELVVYDDQDRPESVKYRRLGVLLIPEVAENRDGLRDLEDETDDLETRIDDLGADADAKEARIDNQQDRIETLESTVERKQDRIEALERENERLRDRLDRVEAHLEIDDQDDAARQGVADD